jgi:hypothetical protein
MMAVRRYTVEELLLLRTSPLVEKPANLPAIEQWIEYVYLDIDGAREKLRIPHSESSEQQKRPNAAGRQPRPGSEASPMGNFSTGQRPGLMTARSAARTGGETLPPETVCVTLKLTQTRGCDAGPAQDDLRL